MGLSKPIIQSNEYVLPALKTINMSLHLGHAFKEFVKCAGPLLQHKHIDYCFGQSFFLQRQQFILVEGQLPCLSYSCPTFFSE